ncbi:MAG: hypothetical protein IPO92_17345 [Saprospiraceae bacterium]|nr:hypothetical protein [Saprospiraceae bacterium]
MKLRFSGSLGSIKYLLINKTNGFKLKRWEKAKGNQRLPLLTFSVMILAGCTSAEPDPPSPANKNKNSGHRIIKKCKFTAGLSLKKNFFGRYNLFIVQIIQIIQIIRRSNHSDHFNQYPTA